MSLWKNPKRIVGLATHIGLDVLSVGVYDPIIHFNNGEKAALDIMELLKVDPGYYMTKSCRSVNMCRKRLSIYRMSEPQKKCQKVLRHSKTEGISCEKGGGLKLCTS